MKHILVRAKHVNMHHMYRNCENRVCVCVGIGQHAANTTDPTGAPTVTSKPGAESANPKL